MIEDKATHRFNNGDLATRGGSKVNWARITRNGKVHRIVGVIVRWNFMGGTFEKPDVTFVLACGPQRHILVPDENPLPLDVCARCDNVVSVKSIIDNLARLI